MKAPLRLFHVFSTFVPGGPQVRTARLANALGTAFQHTVLPMDGRDSARELFDAAHNLKVLPGPSKDGVLRSVGRLRGLIKREQPDAILTYNWGAIEAVLAGRLALGGQRILHHEDGFLPDEIAGFKRRRVWARRALLSGVGALIVPSANLAGIARDSWRLPADRIHFIPNGIRLADFPIKPAESDAPRSNAIRRELGLSEGALLVGSVGHLRGEKNFPRLVEAIAKSGDERLHLLLLGEGEERAAIEAARDRLGLTRRVHLVGHRGETQPYYAVMDIFAMSSDTEQMPVALLEAMSSGLPVVATDVGDIRRMLPDEGQAFVVTRSVDALASALAKLAGDAGERSALGQANRAQVAAKYDEEAMVRAYAKLYTHACQSA